MKRKIDVSYVTTLPLEGNAPRVRIHGTSDELFTVKFFNVDELIKEVSCRGGEEVFGGRQWFHHWYIEVYDSKGELYFKDKFEPRGKVIYVKMDAYALGDNIAWIPIINDFRRKHNCKIICSTFWNDLFIDSYPDIMFLEPNIHIHNVYAQYYIGAHKTGAESYAQLNVDEVPLQKMASHILGMKHFESQPWLGTRFNDTRPRIKGRYVCLSEHASDEKKYWREPGGWQKVVDYLNSQGIKVVVISREPTQLKNVIDLTGDRPIEERMFDLIHAECFLGVSSGLSWLAWGLHRKVIMVSDGTPTFHEFQRGCKRLSENNLEKIDYNYHMVTSWKKVVKALVDWGIS